MRRASALVIAAVLLCGCTSGPGENGSVAGGADAESSTPPSGGEDVATTTYAPPSAEPLPDREVAVDEEGERAASEVSEPGATVSVGEADVQLVGVASVEAEARLPGEVSGPALRVTVRVRNRGEEEISLTGAAVNLAYGADRTPAPMYLDAGAPPLPTSAPPGAEVDGVFLFEVPLEEQDDVRLEIDLAPELEVVVYEGDLSDS